MADIKITEIKATARVTRRSAAAPDYRMLDGYADVVIHLDPHKATIADATVHMPDGSTRKVQDLAIAPDRILAGGLTVTINDAVAAALETPAS